MPLQLSITSGPDSGRVFETGLGELTIGRGRDCSLKLSDPATSRVHFRIVTTADSWTLIDSGSRWGTRVNGAVVQETILQPGDTIEIGDTVLRVELVGAGADAALGTAIPARPQLPTPPAPVASDPHSDSSDDSGDARAPYAIASDWEQRRFHRFRIGQLLAPARTGLVFHATDLVGRNAYALKLFHPVQFSTEDAWRRFLRAVRLSPTFRCEQIVPLVTAGRKEGFCFTVSRYIPGPSAAQLIHKIGIAGMLDWKITLGIAIDLALALVTLEQAQVVHRNITPHNILVESQSMRAYLNDAVLAKAWDTVSVDRLTTDGEIIGDLAFASPEVVGSGFPVDSRADQYSLGATLYALLTGRPPFPCRTVGEMIPAILSQLPVSPREFNLSIPAPFEALILRLLAKRPDARYPNSETLLEDLRKLSRICPSHQFK